MTTTTTSISDAPPKILERILDFLHDDRTTLCSASLVCREWVHAPRHHLFSNTFIAELYGRNDSLLLNNATSFLALAHSKHCTILPAIQSAILAITTPDLMDHVLNILPQLQTLSKVTYLHFAPINLASWNAHALSNVRDFTFEFSWFTLDDDGWRLVTSFRNLHTLSIYIDARAAVTKPPPISASHFSNLRILRLKLDPSRLLFKWLKSLDGTRIALETLDLRIFCSCHSGWGSVRALNSILKGFSATLKHLSLGIDYRVNMDNKSRKNGSRIDLKALVNLRSLFLRTHDLEAVCDSLESLSSSSALDCLTVHAVHWPYDDDSGERKKCHCRLPKLFTRFSGVMERKHFLGIQVLDLNVPEGIELDVVEDLLRKWKDRGALRLSSNDNEDAQPGTLDEIRPLIFSKIP